MAFILSTLLLGVTLTYCQTFSGNGTDCSGYVVDSALSTAYFGSYKLYDFRELANSSSQFDSTPARITVDDDQDDPTYRSELNDALYSTGFPQDWNISTSTRFGLGYWLELNNYVRNIYISQPNESTDYSTYLTLRTTRLAGTQSGAEVFTYNDHLHLSIRVHARVRGSVCGIGGVFTYADDVNEIDIEMRTADCERTVWYSINGSPFEDGTEDRHSSATKYCLAAEWGSWHTHRFDWLPDSVAFYLDDNLSAVGTYGVAQHPSSARVNMWSAGTSFSGLMGVDEGAEIDVQWIELYTDLNCEVINT